MNKYTEVNGDLIEKALSGEFDVIAHGCNCFCTQKSGIAKRMVEVFRTDKFYKEGSNWKGNVDKMGNIVAEDRYVHEGKVVSFKEAGHPFTPLYNDAKKLIVVNCYTQFGFGKFQATGQPDLDYEALTLCLRKIASKYIGKHIGLPKIGAGLAGGDWERIKTIIQETLKDCKVTVVIYDK
jgi:O-acetyl-ADP-ribose deacetylase (regulator of RNase III)